MGFKFEIDTKSIEKKAKEAARKKVLNMNFETNCPHCHCLVTIPKGKSICPFCKKEIDLSVNINF